MALERILFPTTEKCSKIIEWKVKPGSLISKGRVLLHFKTEAEEGEVQKLKATKVGTVNSLLIPDGGLVKPGDEFLEMASCSHPTVIRDLCAECGADLSNEKQTASVPMVHSVPELKVSIEQAQKLGKVDEERLLSHRKLVLLVDLDQTLIHTTNDDVPPNLKDVHHFQLYGGSSPWYHTRLRPLTRKFLEEVSELYELHICTFGARSYAHTIAKILDPDEKLFSHRILSRDECFDPNSKTANLKALFPCGDHMVCIIDDREDVWNFAPNLIAVKPYHFFQHTGDIHAPPGLDKHEQDGSGYMPRGDEISSKTIEVDKLSKEDITNTDADLQSTELHEEGREQDAAEGEHKSEKAESSSNICETSRNENEVVDVKNHSEENTTKNESLVNTKDVTSESKDLDKCEDSTEELAGPTSCAKKELDGTTAENSDIKDTTKNEEKSKEVAGCASSKEDIIDIPDPDDYLLYLKDILQRIHEIYYKIYDEKGEAPNMREVIPSVKRKVLANQSLVFSGIVPTHVPLANSRSAQMARSLGAEVTEQVVPGETTHLVAARPGTVKVNEARRAGTGIHIVSPEWLVCTAERWERAEERLFPLSRLSKRVIPESNSRACSGSLAESLNPLLALSSEDIKSMDQEVEDIFNETDDESAMDRDADSEEDDEEEEEEMKERIKFDNSELCSDVLSEFKTDICFDVYVDEPTDDITTKKRQHNTVDLDDSESEGPQAKLFKDIDNNETPTSDADEDLVDSGDESELNKMGLALEREFLAE